MPVRLEVGPRDLAEGAVTLVRRDTGDEGAGRRSTASPPPVAAAARRRSRPTLLAEATERRDARTVDVTTIDEAAEAAADRLRPHPVGARSAPRARPSWPSDGVTVRCLRDARRLRCPTPSDDADGARRHSSPASY